MLPAVIINIATATQGPGQGPILLILQTAPQPKCCSLNQKPQQLKTQASSAQAHTSPRSLLPRCSPAAPSRECLACRVTPHCSVSCGKCCGQIWRKEICLTSGLPAPETDLTYPAMSDLGQDCSWRTAGR